MNATQKITFAAGALAITIVGALLVTAPMAFAQPVPVTAQSDCATPSLQVDLSGQGCRSANHSASHGAGLIALNRR